MGTTLATKQDLALLRQELDMLRVSVEKDMALLSSTLTVRLGSALGSMLFVGLGLLFAALKLT